MEKDTKIDHDSVKGHRKRVKEKFLKTNFEGWHDYEILEFILFFSIPRIDTKPIAKELIKKFGSLKEVLLADTDKLKEIFKDVDGVGDNTIYFFRFINRMYFYTLKA